MTDRDYGPSAAEAKELDKQAKTDWKFVTCKKCLRKKQK